jgi:hypothetical protein
MQIFLSHSAADGTQAEQVHLALEELGHDVFFDRSSLPKGESFNDRIRDAIADCEVFVFLVSKNSLREGSYCLTELKFIAERWEHPRGRVLPVLLEPLAPSDLPPYLRAVTYLEPQGNVAAETAEAVSRLLARYQRRRFAWVASLVLVAAIAVAGILYRRAEPTGAVPAARELAVSRVERGLGDDGDRCEVSALLANDADKPRTLTRVAIELDSNDFEVALLEPDSPRRRTAALDLEQLFAPGEARRFRWPIETRRAASGALEEELAPVRWRLSWRWHDGEESHTDWQPWRPSGELANGALQPLARSLRHRARCVEARATGERFLLALADDGELVELDASNRPTDRAKLGAEPVALAEGDGFVAVATLAPQSLSLFDAASWKRAGPYALQVRAIPPEHGGGSFSTQPRELAIWEGDVWIRTGEPDRPSELAQFVPEHEIDRVPFRTYYDYELLEELAEPTKETRFAVVGGRLWGAGSGASLRGICSFWEGDLVLYDGHPDPALASARDLAEGPGGTLLVLDRAARLIELSYGEGALHLERTLGQIPVPEEVQSPWVDYRIASRGERVLVGVTLYEQTPELHPIVTRIATWEPRAGVMLLATLPAWEVASIASNSQRGLVVLRHANGPYDAVEIRYEPAGH